MHDTKERGPRWRRARGGCGSFTVLKIVRLPRPQRAVRASSSRIRRCARLPPALARAIRCIVIVGLGLAPRHESLPLPQLHTVEILLLYVNCAYPVAKLIHRDVLHLRRHDPVAPREAEKRLHLGEGTKPRRTASVACTRAPTSPARGTDGDVRGAPWPVRSLPAERGGPVRWLLACERAERVAGANSRAAHPRARASKVDEVRREMHFAVDRSAHNHVIDPGEVDRAHVITTEQVCARARASRNTLRD